MPEDLVRLGCRSGIAVCLALAPTACGDEGATTPGGTGSVEVTTATTGEGLDADGYVVEIVGGPSLTVGINATAMLSEVPASDLEIRLTGVRGNCRVQSPHPRLLHVARNETIRTQFDVVCADTPLLGRIVFHSRRDGDLELYTMNPDGSDPIRLTNTPYNGERYLLELYASASPDGSRILFTQFEGPEEDMAWSEVFVMNADGSDRVNLTNRLEGDDFLPSWSPDGLQIAFSEMLNRATTSGS